MKLASCGSCGAEVEWVVTAKGRRMPLDAIAVGGGNVRVVDGVAVVGAPGFGDRVSHFATCPNAAKHRRRS